MEHYKRKLSQNEKTLLAKVTDKMESIQNSIDAMMSELSNSKVSEAHLVKGKIKKEREKLVPYAELQAAIANPLSRVNYFPQHIGAGEAKQQECSARFIQFVESQL